MIANTFRNKNQHDATFASLGNSHNSRWRPRGLPSVKTLQYKAHKAQIILFSDQKSSTITINVSHVVKDALPLVLCQCEIKMASKMAAKIIK